MAEYKPYFEKLKDPRWQRKRLEILELANFTCEDCGTQEETLHVHHGYYGKGMDPWDYHFKHFHVLCERCHQNATEVMQAIQQSIGRVAPSYYTNLAQDIEAVVKKLISSEAISLIKHAESMGGEFVFKDKGICLKHTKENEQLVSLRLAATRVQDAMRGLIADESGVAPPRAVKESADDVKQVGLDAIECNVRNCTKCPELVDRRTNTVFGDGSAHARIMFVGEAPGADEDEAGKLFLGRTGLMLDSILEHCGLNRKNVYLCNVLKCRPPQNRTPYPHECKNCLGYLSEQIRIISPQYIVCLGIVAAQSLLRTAWSTGKLRGRFYQYENSKVICTYHPSYLIRNPAAIPDVHDDMRFMLADMGIDISKRVPA